MEQTPTKNGYDTTVSIIGALFGTAHFIFQSAADLTAHAEGKIVEKISKGEITAADRTQYRKDATLVNQQKALDHIEAYKAKMKNMAQPKEQLSVA